MLRNSSGTCDHLQLIRKTENFLQELDTQGWRITGSDSEFSEPEIFVYGVGVN